jgi:peptidoglycan/LPS O-acetylase OafA/YrhL
MAPSAFGAIPVIGIVWTLTIELFFYMIVGSINALGWRKFLIPILSVLVLAGMADQQWPLATAFPHGGFRVHLMLILGWWPMFLFGIVIYETRSGWKPRHSWAVACCLAAVFFVGWQYGLVRCAMAGAVFSATRYRIQWLTVKPILYLGTISYPLYLIHPGVGFSIMSYMLRRGYSPYATELIALAASIGSASVLCFAVERPSNLMIRGAWNRRKIRLHAESSRAVAASAK